MKVVASNSQPEPSGITVVNSGVRMQGGYAGWPDGVAVAHSEDGRWTYLVRCNGHGSPSVQRVARQS